MFRRMLRIKNKMTEEDALKLLHNSDDGVLVTVGENGYPYGIPVNYVMYNDKLYVHCAKIGQKISNIKFNNKVSFTTYSNVEIIEDEFTTKYKSVVLFGTATILPSSIEIMNAFIHKYSKSFVAEGIEYVKEHYTDTLLIEITIEHITGKERN